MRPLIFSMILFLVGLESFAQEKTDAMLFGDVKAARTGEHIPFASVMIKGSTIGTAADGTGHFKLPHLPVGRVTLVARALGYKAQEKTVLMERGKPTDVFFELEEDVLNLEQVVVTGTRSAHYVKDTPVRTEIITARAIESKNAANIYQALEGTPGVRVENQCQYCNFTMIRMQGLGAEHTQVLIDGQPMYSGLAGVYGLQQLSTVDVDKIEVVKGAGSALYGSGAVAGAINIVTKEPSLVPATKVDMQLGSHATNKYELSSSMRNENGRLGLTLFAQRYTEGAIDETGAGSTVDEVRNKDGVSDRVMTNLTNAGFGMFADNVFWGDDRIVLRGKSVFEKREGGTMVDDYFRNPLTDGTENITTDRYEGSLAYSRILGESTDLHFTVGYVKHNRNATNDSYLGDYLDTHDGEAPDLRNMRPYLADEHTVTSTLSFGSRIGGHNLMFGVQAFHDVLEESGMYVVVDETSAFRGESYRSVANKNATEFGVYVQDEWTAAAGVMIVPSIRFDSHRSSEEYLADRQVFESGTFPKTNFKETAVNPRLAVKWALSDAVSVRANAGTGFRAPYGFSEDLHLCSGSPRVWKSSDLDPETSLSFNLSADYYGSDVRVSANFFRTNLKNKIGFTDADDAVAAFGYDYQWRNIDDAFVQGVELTVMASPMTDLELGLDLTYNQGEYENAREDWVGTPYEDDSRFISRFPATTGNLRIDYSPADWFFSISANLQGSMYIDYYNEEIDETLGDQSRIKHTNPFILINARAARTIGQFKLYAGVNNLFDFVQDERHLDDAAFMYAPVYGRMLYAGVSIDIIH